MTGFDPRELRRAFGSFMTGVTVVTSLSDDGTPVGFTANSYTSVSLDPPLLLVCPARSLSSFEVFASCRHFAVNILADDQRDVSNIFATSKGNRFEQVAWRPNQQNIPLIDGAAAHFSCALHHRQAAGDHLILVGRIEQFNSSGAAGLGYCNTGYFSLDMERRAEAMPLTHRRVTVGAIVEHDGGILLDETPTGFCPPQLDVSQRNGSLAALATRLSAAGLSVAFGPVYSIFEGDHAGRSYTYYRATASTGETGEFGRYVDIELIPSLTFTNPGHADMFQRYLLERQSGVFGLYVGDDSAGDIHLFGEA